MSNEHTPTTLEIRKEFMNLDGTFANGSWDVGSLKRFDRWYQDEIAAAEQRGAVMVMDALKREASDSSWEGIVQPGRSLQELVDHIEHGIRADLLEGDE